MSSLRKNHQTQDVFNNLDKRSVAYSLCIMSFANYTHDNR